HTRFSRDWSSDVCSSDLDLALYVVDARQADHFIQVFRAARKGSVAGKMRMEHIPFGTMNGPDGKPFKTREGGVVSLRDLIDMVEDRKSVVEGKRGGRGGG